MNLHMLTVYGLALNGVGGFILVVCPPPVLPHEIMEDGREKIARTYVRELFPFPPSQKRRLRYYMRFGGYRIGLIFLVCGFALQLAVELMR